MVAGKSQLSLGPDEVTLQRAVKETGYSRKVLKEGAEDDRFTHRVAERPGRQPDAIVFHLPTLRAQIAQTECSYPPCKNPAPGRSGRCGEHAARVKYGTVELVCQYEKCHRKGKPFTRPGSWLRENPDSRGHFCSNECQGLAHAESRPGYLQALNPDGAREHFRTVHEEARASGMALTPEIAQASATSMSTIRLGAANGTIPSELREIHGSRLRVYPAEAVDRYTRKWVRGRPWDDRKRFVDPDFAVKQQQCKLRALVARGLTERQAAAAIRADVEVRRSIFAQARQRLSPGRPRATHHGDWHVAYTELRGWYESQVCAGQAEQVPGPWSLCKELARELFPDDVGNATARIYSAIKSLQSRTK